MGIAALLGVTKLWLVPSDLYPVTCTKPAFVVQTLPGLNVIKLSIYLILLITGKAKVFKKRCSQIRIQSLDLLPPRKLGNTLGECSLLESLLEIL